MKSFSKIVYRNFSQKRIVISGCGVPGCALALALCMSPMKPEILMVDIQKPPSLEELIKSRIPDQRVITVNNESIRFLKSIGGFPFKLAERRGEFKEMVIWEALGSNYFVVKNEFQVLAQVAEIKNIQSTLIEKLQTFSNVEFSAPNSIEDMHITPQAARLKLKSGEEVETELVVGSDGINSKVKNIVGIQNYGWLHSQYGIVCSLHCQDIEGVKKAFQRFTPSGPIALLPLWDDYYSLVWSTSLDEHQYLMAMSDEDFVRNLNRNLNRKSDYSFVGFDLFGQSLDFTPPPLINAIANKRMSFPLSNIQARTYHTNRVALIGDAAHTVHPMAGQGLNMGLMDAAILANVITRSLKAGNDLGDELFLREFSSQSKIYNSAMSIVVEYVKTSYAATLPPIVFLRNSVIGGINSLPFFKDTFAKFASGEFFKSSYEWENNN